MSFSTRSAGKAPRQNGRGLGCLARLDGTFNARACWPGRLAALDQGSIIFLRMADDQPAAEDKYSFVIASLRQFSTVLRHWFNFTSRCPPRMCRRGVAFATCLRDAQETHDARTGKKKLELFERRSLLAPNVNVTFFDFRERLVGLVAFQACAVELLYGVEKVTEIRKMGEWCPLGLQKSLERRVVVIWIAEVGFEKSIVLFQEIGDVVQIHC